MASTFKAKALRLCPKLISRHEEEWTKRTNKVGGRTDGLFGKPLYRTYQTASYNGERAVKHNCKLRVAIRTSPIPRIQRERTETLSSTGQSCQIPRFQNREVSPTTTAVLPTVCHASSANLRIFHQLACVVHSPVHRASTAPVFAR